MLTDVRSAVQGDDGVTKNGIPRFDRYIERQFGATKRTGKMSREYQAVIEGWGLWERFEPFVTKWVGKL